MTTKKLTPTMLKALTLARSSADGCLMYRAGGFWTSREMPCNVSGIPNHYVGAQTIYALEDRGMLQVLPTSAQRYRCERQITALGRTWA